MESLTEPRIHPLAGLPDQQVPARKPVFPLPVQSLYLKTTQLV